MLCYWHQDDANDDRHAENAVAAEAARLLLVSDETQLAILEEAFACFRGLHDEVGVAKREQYQEWKKYGRVLVERHANCKQCGTEFAHVIQRHAIAVGHVASLCRNCDRERRVRIGKRGGRAKAWRDDLAQISHLVRVGEDLGV